jgi:predicted outer membrane protein
MFCAAAVGLLVVGSRLRADVKPASRPEDFLARAAEWNAIEKELAQTAVKSAANVDVKKFAQGLLSDQERFEKEIADIAKEQKLAVAVVPDKAQRDRVKEIEKARGDDFDRKFLAYVVESHERALTTLDRKDLTNEKCRAAAERVAEKVRTHLEEARALQKKLGF